MKPESWGCLDSFINYIQRQLHLWLTPSAMYPVGGRILCWGSVCKPSSLWHPFQKIREFPKPSSILIIHQKDSWHSLNSVILPVPVFMGQDQNQLRQEMWASAGGFREWTFPLSFPGSEEFRSSFLWPQSMGQILIFFVTLSFYILALMWYSRKKYKAVLLKKKPPFAKNGIQKRGASVNQENWSNLERGRAWEGIPIKRCVWAPQGSQQLSHTWYPTWDSKQWFWRWLNYTIGTCPDPRLVSG